MLASLYGYKPTSLYATMFLIGY